jgi:hypothetical protein
MRKLCRLANLTEVRCLKPQALLHHEKQFLVSRLIYFRQEQKYLHLLYTFVSNK